MKLATYTYSQGHLNYSADGSVDFADLLIVAQNYGKRLLPVTVVGAPTSATARRRSPATSLLA